MAVLWVNFTFAFITFLRPISRFAVYETLVVYAGKSANRDKVKVDRLVTRKLKII